MFTGKKQQYERCTDSSAPRDTPVLESHPNHPLSDITPDSLPGDTDDILETVEIPTPGMVGVHVYAVVRATETTLRVFHQLDQRWHKAARISDNKDAPDTLAAVVDKLRLASHQWYQKHLLPELIDLAVEKRDVPMLSAPDR